MLQNPVRLMFLRAMEDPHVVTDQYRQLGRADAAAMRAQRIPSARKATAQRPSGPALLVSAAFSQGRTVSYFATTKISAGDIRRRMRGVIDPPAEGDETQPRSD
jgi:hypothetical protein